MSGYGKLIELYIDDIRKIISVRDHGRGIPLNQMYDVATKMGFSFKCNSELFKKSIGVTFPGTGLKVVNAIPIVWLDFDFCRELCSHSIDGNPSHNRHSAVSFLSVSFQVEKNAECTFHFLLTFFVTKLIATS